MNKNKNVKYALGEILKDADGDIGTIVELPPGGVWVRLRMALGGKERLVWNLLRNCRKEIK